MTTTRVPSLLLLLGLVCLASPAALAQDPEVFGEGEATVPAEAEEAPRPRPTGPGNEDIDLDRLFPPDRRIYQWEWMDPDSVAYSGRNLAGYFGVGAELYEEYGVEELRWRDYQKGHLEARVELFRTRDADGAYGLYTIFNAEGQGAPPEMTNVEVDDQGDEVTGDVRLKGNKFTPPLKGDNYRVYNAQGAEFFKGRVYGRISVSGEVEDRDMLAFVYYMLEAVPKDGVRPQILRELPKPGKIANSERYLVGPISILELDIPAPADLFGLAGSVRAATAVYRYGEGFTYDVLVVQYPNPSWAQSKYDALVRFFQGTEGFQVYPPDRGIPQPFFVFKDLGTEEFGALKLEGTRLLLYTRVPNAPLFKQLLTTGGNIAITGRMP